MNTKWFRDRLRGIELSQRGLTKLLDVDAAAVSYMLRGQRKMTLQDCAVSWCSPVLWIKP